MLGAVAVHPCFSASSLVCLVSPLSLTWFHGDVKFCCLLSQLPWVEILTERKGSVKVGVSGVYLFCCIAPQDCDCSHHPTLALGFLFCCDHIILDRKFRASVMNPYKNRFTDYSWNCLLSFNNCTCTPLNIWYVFVFDTLIRVYTNLRPRV